MAQNEYEEYLISLQKEMHSFGDVLFYEKEKAVRLDRWHDFDWLIMKERVEGRKFGCRGIGKLREVCLSKITEYENHPWFGKDPEYFDGIYREKSDTQKWMYHQENYARVLKENYVKVNWIEFPNPPIDAYGPYAVHEVRRRFVDNKHWLNIIKTHHHDVLCVKNGVVGKVGLLVLGNTSSGSHIWEGSFSRTLTLGN